MNLGSLTTLREGWKGKLLEIFLILIPSVSILVYYSGNLPEFQTKANWYWWLAILNIGLIALLFSLSFILKKKLEKVGASTAPIIYEEKTIFSTSPSVKRFLIIFSIIVFFITLFMQFQTQASIMKGAEFGLIENKELDTILSVMAAFQEDYFFFAIIPIVMFFVIVLLTKQPILALIIVLIVNPIIFTIYHSYRYGLTKVKETIDVWGFAQISTGWVLFIRDLSLVHALHASSNIAYTQTLTVIG